MIVDQQAVREFEETIRKDIPKFKVAFKDKSWLMKVCGFLTRPFNAEFMTRFTTTMGNTVYFATQEKYGARLDGTLRILAHEYIHLYDNKQHPLTFQPSYIFPQVLALLPALAFMILAWPWSWLVLVPAVAYVLTCLIAMGSRTVSLIFLGLALIGFGVGAWWLVGWKLLVLLGGLLFLIPWPAPWRTKWELRGYSMNVAFAVWWGYWSDDVRERMVPHFTGPNYFFMCWSGSRVRTALDQAVDKVRTGELAKEKPYKTVHDFLYERRLLGR